MLDPWRIKAQEGVFQRETGALPEHAAVPNLICTSTIITTTIESSKGLQYLTMLGTVFVCDLVMGKTSTGPGTLIQTSPVGASQ
jgi:hypothetical protein